MHNGAAWSIMDYIKTYSYFNSKKCQPWVLRVIYRVSLLHQCATQVWLINTHIGLDGLVWIQFNCKQPNALYARNRATLLECSGNFLYQDAYLNRLYNSGAVCIVDGPLAKSLNWILYSELSFQKLESQGKIKIESFPKTSSLA